MLGLKRSVIEKPCSPDGCTQQKDMNQVHIPRSPEYASLQCALPVLLAYSQVHPGGHQPGEKDKSIRSRGIAEGIGKERLQRVLRQMGQRHEDEEIAP